MNNRIHFLSLAIILSAASIMFGSCEKVIDIDLDEVEKKYVIEAVVADDEELTQVVITKSKKFR